MTLAQEFSLTDHCLDRFLDRVRSDRPHAGAIAINVRAVDHAMPVANTRNNPRIRMNSDSKTLR
jgi:hypothetical protein